MNRIAAHPYYKAERKMTGLAQETVMQEREIVLYRDRVVSRYRRFSIGEVHDMSYKRMGEEDGMLYLHTAHGVYPYTVKADPEPFIRAFKQLKENRM